MDSQTISKGILRAIFTLVGVTLFFYFLYRIQSIIVYLLIAIIISLIARPIINFQIRRFKFPNTLAVVNTMVLFIFAFLGLLRMFIPLIVEQGHNLSLLNLEQLQIKLEVALSQLDFSFLGYHINFINELKGFEFFKNLVVIPEILNTIAGTLGSFSIGLFSVIFISFFFMKDYSLVENSIYTIGADKNKGRLQKSLASINNLLSRYFIGLVFQISILFLIYTVSLLIFGVENAVVIAFLCALLNLIPYVGPLIGGILMLFLTISSNLGQDFQSVIIPTTVFVMIGYIFAQLIDNFLSQPLIFSNSVKSHPLEIFLVIMISGVLFGALGMIIAVPTYTVIKVILKEFLSDNRIVKSLTKNL